MKIDDAKREHYIYGLIDPRTNLVRYIGKSIHPENRLKGHLKIKIARNHKERWLLKLKSMNMIPNLIILEQTSEFLINQAEKFWIAKYRNEGFSLTNGTDGGDGGALGPEGLAKMIASKTGKPGKPRSLETIAKIAESNRGKKRPPESVARVNAANTGLKRSEEVRAKMREARKGRIISKETCAKISASRMGIPPWNKGLHPPSPLVGVKQSPELVEKRRNSLLRYYENRKMVS